jgi:hypothetical protein
MNIGKVSTGLNAAITVNLRVAFKDIPQYGVDYPRGFSVQVSGFRRLLPDFNAQIATDKMPLLRPVAVF